MATRFKHYPSNPRRPECQNGYLILCNAHDAASSFLGIFETVRKAREAKGMPTDEEQDLLRAMLVFATAGLDSLVKQLIRDALPTVVNRDLGASQMFKQFIERRLKTSDGIDRGFLAGILADAEPRQRLLDELVSDLASGSLLSTEELLRAASFFNIPSKDICSDTKRLTEIFSARNQIVHEMDIDFSQINRTRRPRAKDIMTDHTNEVFKISVAFVSHVDRKLH